MNPKSVACLVLISVLFQRVHAKDVLDRAYSFYLSGDYREAQGLWLNAARGGNTSAQMSLGYLYEQGKGLRKDDARAMAWYRKAAEAGLAEAQYRLGLMYELGKGVRADVWEAEAWYQRATDQGFCPGELDEPEDFLSRN